MQLLPLSEIRIAPDRQRREIDQESLVELASSIAAIGLIHPIVVNGTSEGIVLVAGERRLRAIDTIWNMGQFFTHGGKLVPEGKIPCTFLKDLSPLDAMEIELEENIRRQDLSWQDRSVATSQLYELRRLQAEKRGDVPITTIELANELYPDHHPKAADRAVRKEIILARHLSDPDVAAAKSVEEGLKVIRRKEEASRNAALGVAVGRVFSARDHTLLQGNCLSEMRSLPPASFDCILTDPPYGIDAQNFNDSGGKADAAGHTYDDSLDNWLILMDSFLPECYRLAKPQAHAYVFCDVDNFLTLRRMATDAGWKCFRTPLIWHNPSSQRAPWPHSGPHRRYQICLYAIKGDRPCLRLAPDVVNFPSDENLGWAAQKPVALYSDFLSRSCRAGDSVLDPFCGTGTIFPSAHALKVKATGIELDPTAYGIAAGRLQLLK